MASPALTSAASTPEVAQAAPAPAEEVVDLRQPDLYFNRELSLLEFNRRVLEQARDESVPLLERLKFLCIVSSNLDEFFEIRVAGLKQQVALGAAPIGPDRLGPSEQLRRIAETTRALIRDQYAVLNDALIPRLAAHGIRFLKRSEWSARQERWVKRHFNRELLPVLSPIGLDPAHPFPRILNKSLNFIVNLEGKDAFGRDSGIAIVQAPRSLPRLIRMPESHSEGSHDFVFLSSIIHAHVGDLFPGMRPQGCFQFRVTRNSDLLVDDEEVDDLLRALEGELPARRFSDAVRLEVADDCPAEMTIFLSQQFKLGAEDVYQCNGPVNLMRLMAIGDLVDRPDLKYPGFAPGQPPRLTRNTDLFDTIRKGDVLLHHPFQSFAPVVDFVRQAAADPDVLTIKQTLYRTGSDSAIAETLVAAARTGKEVTVVIELRARFEEEANIELASDLQEAGAHVVYGIVGHKTHAKMTLVVRREGRQLRRYVHLGTGNYHARTARLYTDYGLLTCDAAIAEDCHKLFQQLTAPGRPGKLKRLLQSPFTLHKTLLQYIEREAALARAGKPARIIAKLNALDEEQVIRALYAASQAGVRIDLIVRGVCCLRPGIKGVSENIQVRSIIGRFLEHSRVYYFGNGGEEEVLLSSADWMARNFFRRIETAFPIDDKRLRQRIIQLGLMTYLSDNTQAWVLEPSGTLPALYAGRAQTALGAARALGGALRLKGRSTIRQADPCRRAYPALIPCRMAYPDGSWHPIGMHQALPNGLISLTTPSARGADPSREPHHRPACLSAPRREAGERRLMSRSTGLEQFHAQDRCDPLLWSLLPMGIWMAALSGSVAVDSVPAAVILSIIGGVAGSQLFVIGHDACHGSLTASRLLNALIGRMAFVPSAHSFSLWAYFHNGLHHNFTNLRGHDFVWTPLSPDEFSRLSKLRQFMECIYRHPTGAGIGLYYAIELWRRRLAWPTRIVPRRVAPSAYADVATTVTTWLLVGGGTAFLFDLDVLRFLGGMALFAGVSLIIITWAIGFVVYFNHTHPRLKWYGCAAQWQEEFSQEAGACHVTFSGIWWYVLPNVVMNHTLHHLDTRIPARHLADAETHLESATGTRLLSWRWTPARHYAVMKRCGLYDYAKGRWVSLDWKRIGEGRKHAPKCKTAVNS